MTKVWVVMGNDFPDAVFSSEGVAEAYIKEKKKSEPSEQCAGYKANVYWRTHEFELREDL